MNLDTDAVDQKKKTPARKVRSKKAPAEKKVRAQRIKKGDVGYGQTQGNDVRGNVRKVVRVKSDGTHETVVDEHIEPDTESPEFIQQLAIFVETGTCPKCHSKLKRAYERHLRLCRGVTEVSTRKNADREALALLPPEVRSSQEPDAKRQKMMARFSKLRIGGMKSFGENSAKWTVIGSTGRGYEVSFQDGSTHGSYSGFPRKCNCMDARTRRHDCKHISYLMCQIGMDLDIDDEEWNATWRSYVEDNVKSFKMV